MAKVVKIAEISAEIKKISMRSAWGKGVQAWALSVLEKTEGSFQSAEALEEALLNGAKDWRHFCEGGNALIYNQDIAERFCTPSELRKTAGGLKDPNARESWMDAQCRAAFQAWCLISETFENLLNR